MADARSLYDSGKLLIKSSLVSISPLDTTSDYKKQIASHCASILSAFEYVDLQRSKSGMNVTAPFRMIYPSKLVCAENRGRVAKDIYNE